MRWDLGHCSMNCHKGYGELKIRLARIESFASSLSNPLAKGDCFL